MEVLVEKSEQGVDEIGEESIVERGRREPT